jgi:hypothetical protein
VWVTNFNFNGHTADPGALPGMPPEYGRYFGPGTGGFITHDEVPVDPNCVALAQQRPPYAQPRQGAVGCLGTGGTMTTRSIGAVGLGDRESDVRSRLGEPNLIRRGFMRWCLQGGGSLRVGNAADRSGSSGTGDDPTLVVLTTSPAYRLHRIHVGSTLRALRRAFRGERRAFTAAGARVWLLSPRGGLAAGVRRNRVTYLAAYDRSALRARRALRDFLQRGG